MTNQPDITALGEPMKATRELLVPASAEFTLRHAASIIESILTSSLVPSVPGEPPTQDQIKAAFNRLRYDIELAESQAGIKR